MRLIIQLTSMSGRNILPVNYQYPLSAAIYKVIAQANREYATFLHNQGYHQDGSLKAFKLFTFSDLRTPFEIDGDRLIMKTNRASLMICFQMPDTITNFVRGLFLNQQIEIADQKNRAVFQVEQVEALQVWHEDTLENDFRSLVLKPISPMVVGVLNERHKYDFIYPSDERFIPALKHHWKEKYKVVYGEEAAGKDFKDIEIEVLNVSATKTRLVTIKAGTEEETKIRGMVHFQLHVKAPVKVFDLALNAGIGAYCSQGFGCVEVVPEE